jgi:hypothetical protein
VQNAGVQQNCTFATCQQLHKAGISAKSSQKLKQKLGPKRVAQVSLKLQGAGLNWNRQPAACMASRRLPPAHQSA